MAAGVAGRGVGHEFRDPAVGSRAVMGFQAGSTERPLRGRGVACWPGHGSDTGGMGLDMIQEPPAFAGCWDAGQRA